MKIVFARLVLLGRQDGFWATMKGFVGLGWRHHKILTVMTVLVILCPDEWIAAAGAYVGGTAVTGPGGMIAAIVAFMAAMMDDAAFAAVWASVMEITLWRQGVPRATK